MKLNLNRFYDHLKTRPLSSIYLLSGDEILLVQEARDALARKAKQAGFSERKVFYISPQFNWNEFLYSGNSLSLFSEKNLIELHVPTGKVGVSGKKALLTYFQNLSADNLLLIITGKLEQSTQRTEWVKTLDSLGIFVQVWPVTIREFPNWIRTRLAENGLKASSEAVRFLAEQCEGNLLAANQVIEKLVLMYRGSADFDTSSYHSRENGNLKDAINPVSTADCHRVSTADCHSREGGNPDSQLTSFSTGSRHPNIADNLVLQLSDIVEIVSDQSHYNLFEFIDYVLLGELKHTIQILHFFREEGTEPILILWALARELRSLIVMIDALNQGKSIAQTLAIGKVWEKRKSIVSAALKRHIKSGPHVLTPLLQQAYHIDLVIKGIEQGNVWELLEKLCLRLAQ